MDRHLGVFDSIGLRFRVLECVCCVCVFGGNEGDLDVWFWGLVEVHFEMNLRSVCVCV